MRYPLDINVKTLQDVPYTISYVIRKRQQVDNLSELGKEKRPSESLIWDESPEELESWLERILSGKEQAEIQLSFNEWEVER